MFLLKVKNCLMLLKIVVTKTKMILHMKSFAIMCKANSK